MTVSPSMRSSRGSCLLLLLWLIGPSMHAACAATELRVNTAPEPVTLPIVEASDNRFLRLFTAKGAPQTKVDSIVQDDAGFMWFGTHFGLYRYDGYDFKV